VQALCGFRVLDRGVQPQLPQREHVATTKTLVLDRRTSLNCRKGSMWPPPRLKYWTEEIASTAATGACGHHPSETFYFIIKYPLPQLSWGYTLLCHIVIHFPWICLKHTTRSFVLCPPKTK
jgi:hypothetical protein